MRDQYMRTGEGFIICYSVTDRRTFDEATAYKRLIGRVRNTDDVPVVLVGNKCDLQLEREVRLALHLYHSLSTFTTLQVRLAFHLYHFTGEICCLSLPVSFYR